MDSALGMVAGTTATLYERFVSQYGFDDHCVFRQGIDNRQAWPDSLYRFFTRQ